MILKIGELEYPIENYQTVIGLDNNYWDSNTERAVITFLKNTEFDLTELYNSLQEQFQGEFQIITSDKIYTYTKFKQLGSLTTTIAEDEYRTTLSMI